VATTGWNNYQHAGIIKKEAAAATQQIIELATMYGMDVIAALAILIIDWMIAGWAGNKMRKALTKSSKVAGNFIPFRRPWASAYPISLGVKRPGTRQ
jgi:hypothetical protein